MPVMLITGGSRGIGAAIARGAARTGYDVCVNYHSSHQAAETLAADIRTLGREVLTLQCDVSKEDSVEQMFVDTVNQLGTPDVLVNNAGVLESGSIATIDARRLRRVFETNVFGAFYCAREAIRLMAVSRGGNGGSIINISSVAAKLGSPGEYVDYAASKGAIDTMTVGLASEVVDEKIRVNAVRPGVIYTEIHASGGEPERVDRVAQSVPMQRGGTVEEVANAVLWLASDQATYCTGTFVDVSGGR